MWRCHTVRAWNWGKKYCTENYSKKAQKIQNQHENGIWLPWNAVFTQICLATLCLIHRQISELHLLVCFPLLSWILKSFTSILLIFLNPEEVNGHYYPYFMHSRLRHKNHEWVIQDHTTLQRKSRTLSRRPDWAFSSHHLTKFLPIVGIERMEAN